MSRLIPLTQGQSAIVDDADFDWLSQWRWHVFTGSSGHIYAARNGARREDGSRPHIFMHREIAATPDDMFADHINGNGLDNQRPNLRNVTRTQNNWNRRANARGTSSAKGVYWHGQRQKWAASIQINKKRRHLGLFESEADASAAYHRAAVAAHGRFYRSAEQ